MMLMCVVFFFQAEDGIRGRNVTGVQTCALPISNFEIPNIKVRAITTAAVRQARNRQEFLNRVQQEVGIHLQVLSGKKEAYYDYRSEERRVGKECRSRWCQSRYRARK